MKAAAGRYCYCSAVCVYKLKQLAMLHQATAEQQNQDKKEYSKGEMGG